MHHHHHDDAEALGVVDPIDAAGMRMSGIHALVIAKRRFNRVYALDERPAS
jgi:hypothetical protein